MKKGSIRKKYSVREKHREAIIELRKIGISSRKIATKLKISKSTVDLVLYPKILEQHRINMDKRYQRMKREGRCHMCGQFKSPALNL